MAKLGDFMRIKHGFAFKGDYITAEDNEIVLVTPGNFEIGGGFKEKKCKFFSGDYPKDYVLHADDLFRQRRLFRLYAQGFGCFCHT